jgi:hypothetical protein
VVSQAGHGANKGDEGETKFKALRVFGAIS